MTPKGARLTKQGARRPYVTHSTELGFALRDIDSALLALEDVLGAAKGEVSDPELAEQLTNEIHAGYVSTLADPFNHI